MSQQLINHSADLKKLRDEGYDISVVSSHLVLKNVPYVNAQKEIRLGMLVSELSLAGDTTTKPSTHVVSFAGEYPCDHTGVAIEKIRHNTSEVKLGEHLCVQHSFSSKPVNGYKDYYEKMTTYAQIVSSYARVLDPNQTAQIYAAIESNEEESVFRYIDTASSRAGINTVTAKLEIPKVAIIGLGGTGSYILDLICKCPIKEIHIYDGDKFLQHNAFRAPGAPTIEALKCVTSKVEYFAALYSNIHKGIKAHSYYLDVATLNELHEMNFVFLALDKGEAKRLIIAKLVELGIPFVDVGMGVNIGDDSLGGVLRITSSSAKRPYQESSKRIPLSNIEANNDYARNIQIADLNALNAALAVIKWKKMFGFYRDLIEEHHSTYSVDVNMLTNEDAE